MNLSIILSLLEIASSNAAVQKKPGVSQKNASGMTSNRPQEQSYQERALGTQEEVPGSSIKPLKKKASTIPDVGLGSQEEVPGPSIRPLQRKASAIPNVGPGTLMQSPHNNASGTSLSQPQKRSYQERVLGSQEGTPGPLIKPLKKKASTIPDVGLGALLQSPQKNASQMDRPQEGLYHEIALGSQEEAPGPSVNPLQRKASVVLGIPSHPSQPPPSNVISEEQNNDFLEGKSRHSLV